MSDETSSKSDRFGTAIAIAIAVTSVVGAIIAGSAARLSSEAGDTQQAAFTAVVNYQKADTLARTSLYRELRALADRRQYTALADSLDADADAAEAAGDLAGAENLRAQADQYRASAGAADSFISPEYQSGDGTYDEAAYLQDQLLYAQQDRDINASDDYARAQNLRSRAEGLVLSLIGLSVAVLSFTIAEHTQKRWRVLFFSFGLTVLACGLCTTLAGDMLRAWLANV